MSRGKNFSPDPMRESKPKPLSGMPHTPGMQRRVAQAEPMGLEAERKRRPGTNVGMAPAVTVTADPGKYLKDTSGKPVRAGMQGDKIRVISSKYGRR
jgi:hypothetical protein